MRRTALLAAFGLAISLVAGPSALAVDADEFTITGLKPADPQPGDGAMKPGLAVTYYSNKFNHVDEIFDWAEYRNGRPGEPIPILDYHVGEGDVLTSGKQNLVGAMIEGYINFPEPGVYAFVVESNDGVLVEIAGELILLDPDVHFDRFSEISTVQIDEAGWYDLFVVYFEKKSTSTLRLFWNKPGEEGEMAIIPAEQYAHVPE